MRIPHYLQLAPSGVWHYRQRIPARLIPLVGRSMVKKSLVTRELGIARDLALRWWRAYDELHTNTRRMSMAGKTMDVQLLIERLKRAGQHYRLTHKPDGTIEVEVLGPEHHALAMDAVTRIGDMTRESFIQQAVAESRKTTRAAAASPTPAPPTAPVARQVIPKRRICRTRLLARPSTSGKRKSNPARARRHSSSSGWPSPTSSRCSGQSVRCMK